MIRARASLLRYMYIVFLPIVIVWVFVKDVDGGVYVNRASPVQILYCVLVLKEEGNASTPLCWYIIYEGRYKGFWYYVTLSLS
jgi:hypothetical protein